MTAKTHQSAESQVKQAKQISKNGIPETTVSTQAELKSESCPISRRIIKEISVDRQKAMERLADL